MNVNKREVVFQPCMVLQRRHLPDRPVEYLLKLRCTAWKHKLREVWIAADKLCTEFAVGRSLIKHFEASKVGQLAVDTYLSKRRSMPSPVFASNNHISPHGSSSNSGPRNKNVQPKAVKRKSSDIDGRSNCIDHVSSKSLKNNCIANSKSSPFSASKGVAHKLLMSAKNLKLPNAVCCKPTIVQKSPMVNGKLEDSDSDSDSDEDVRYSLSSDKLNSSSKDRDLGSKSSGFSEKKRRKLPDVNEVKKSKSSRMESKQPDIDEDEEIKFKPLALSSANQNCKPGIATN